MRTETAHAIVRLREIDSDLAASVHPATVRGFCWSPGDWAARHIPMAIGWHRWKLKGAHKLGLFDERRGPKASIPWQRKHFPWLRVVFLNGARCASAPPVSPGGSERSDIECIGEAQP